MLMTLVAKTYLVAKLNALLFMCDIIQMLYIYIIQMTCDIDIIIMPRWEKGGRVKYFSQGWAATQLSRTMSRTLFSIFMAFINDTFEIVKTKSLKS